MNYQNTYRISDFNASIDEWDIRAANVSISREYNLLPAKILEKIENEHKYKRERSVGMLMLKDKDFAKALESKFDEVMQIFILQNQLEVDWDILSIRKDAAFVINRDIKYPFVGKNIEFRKKNHYLHHIYLKPKHGKDLDIYVNNDIIDVKGINDDLLPLHEEGIIDLIKLICKCHYSKNPKAEINELFSDLVCAYKKRELPYDYYREFNPNSKFKMDMFGNEVLVDGIDSDDMLELVDISYNYESVILPLIRMLR